MAAASAASDPALQGSATAELFCSGLCENLRPAAVTNTSNHCVVHRFDLESNPAASFCLHWCRVLLENVAFLRRLSFALHVVICTLEPHKTAFCFSSCHV